MGGGLTAASICSVLSSVSRYTRIDFVCVFADDLSRKAKTHLNDAGLAGWCTPNGVLLLTHGMYTHGLYVPTDVPTLKRTDVECAAQRATATKGPLWELAAHDTYVLTVATYDHPTNTGGWGLYAVRYDADGPWRFLTSAEHAQYDRWLYDTMLPKTWPPQLETHR